MISTKDYSQLPDRKSLEKDKAKMTNGLPAILNDFIFGEPVASIGTTFCLWTTELKNWQVGQLLYISAITIRVWRTLEVWRHNAEACQKKNPGLIA